MSKPAKSLPNMRAIKLGQLKDRAKIERLKPTEQNMIDTFGEHRIERKFRKDGNYSWRVKVKQNDGHGKVTNEGHAMRDLMMPYARASTFHAAEVNGFPGGYAGRGRGKIHSIIRGGKFYRVVNGELIEA